MDDEEEEVVSEFWIRARARKIAKALMKKRKERKKNQTISQRGLGKQIVRGANVSIHRSIIRKI